MPTARKKLTMWEVCGMCDSVKYVDSPAPDTLTEAPVVVPKELQSYKPI